MASADEKSKTLKFDKRLQEWMVSNNQITKEELKKHLDELPDLASRVDLLRMGEEKHQPRSDETH